MMFRFAFWAIVSAASLSNGFVPRQASFARGGALPMSTEAKEKVEGKKAGKDAPPVNLGWDSHTAVVSVLMIGQSRYIVGVNNVQILFKY